MHLSVYIYLCIMYVPGTHRDQKRAVDPLELELQAVNHLIRGLGTGPSSARATVLLTAEPTFLPLLSPSHSCHN